MTAKTYFVSGSCLELNKHSSTFEFLESVLGGYLKSGLIDLKEYKIIAGTRIKMTIVEPCMNSELEKIEDILKSNFITYSNSNFHELNESNRIKDYV